MNVVFVTLSCQNDSFIGLLVNYLFRLDCISNMSVCIPVQNCVGKKKKIIINVTKGWFCGLCFGVFFFFECMYSNSFVSNLNDQQFAGVTSVGAALNIKTDAVYLVLKV